MNKSIYRLLSILAAFALVLGNSYKAGTSSIYVAGAAANDEVHWTITGSNSITLDWRGPSHTVSYGITTAYGSMVTAIAPSPMPFSSAGPFWEAKLVNLQPNTTYHYSIGGEADHTFKTALPKGNSGFTVDVIGDVGDTTSYKNVGPIQAMIAADQPSLALIVGDLTYGNTNGQAVVDQHFNDVQVWSLGSTAYMPAWGNHEWDTSGDNLKNYKGRFDFPNQQTSPGSPAVSCCGEDWYYFDYGNTRFIAYPEPFSGAWSDWNTHAKVLMDEAQADPAITFIVTFGHRPAYSSGYHSGDTTLQSYLDALGASHSKYVLNLNGHSHNYERTFPQSNVVHITAGTGGSGLEEIGTCLWGICTQPAWSAKRYMHLGVLKLTFNTSSIQGAFICGPSGGGTNDINCAQGDVIDTFTIPTGTKHYTANEEGAYTDAEAVGFNVHDTGMSTGTINALPVGSQAMVWVGIGSSNCSTTLSSTFTSFVLANTTNPKLYGFYLTDEPLDNTCVAAVTAYTNYIHANAPGKKAFILLTDWPGTYAAYRPAVTNVDLIGLDPYPVKDGTYDNTLISHEINNAIAAGIPLANIVPVFQTFGGAGWDAPTASQLTTILDQWAALVPNPPLDYAYSWGTQSNYLSDALVNRADWRDIMAAHNQALDISALTVVTSIVRASANPTTSATSVDFTVKFSEVVTGVDTIAPFSDFALTTTGDVSGAAITRVSGLGDTYTVTVNTGSGNGTIRLDVVDDDSIVDVANNPLGGVGAGNGDFTTGQTYTVDTCTLTGNAGVRGVVLSYADGTPKTVIADGSGNYMITVPAGWSGTVTPYKPGYTFAPINRSYNNLQSNQFGQNYTAQVCVGCADVNVNIGGNSMGSYTIPSSGRVTPIYRGLNNGPVRVIDNVGIKIIASERAYRNVTNLTDFNEMMGLPVSLLTTEYWFPLYDARTSFMQTYLSIGNASTDSVNHPSANVSVYIGGQLQGTYVIPYRGRTTPIYQGLNNGPVQVKSTNGVPIIASERAYRNVTNLTDFNEMMGLPVSLLTTEYWFPLYDARTSFMQTYLSIGNASTDSVNHPSANVSVYIGGQLQGTYVIPYRGRTTPIYQGLNNGPVQVKSTNGVPIIASERAYRNVTNLTDFNEMMGLPVSLLTTEYWFPLYDARTSFMQTYLSIGNASTDSVNHPSANVSVYIGGQLQGTYVIPYRGRTTPIYQGLNNGPVQVKSTNGVPIIASERAYRNVTNLTDFNEMMGLPVSLLTTEYWFPLYDARTSFMQTYLSIGNAQ